MIMENELKQPSYNELAQAYTNAVRALEDTKAELQAIKMDKILERLQIMMNIIEHKSSYPKQIVKLAEWHMKQIMSKST